MTEWDWEEWFNTQDPLTHQLDKAVKEITKNKDDTFRLSIWTAVIEHAAEVMRSCITPSEDKNNG